MSDILRHYQEGGIFMHFILIAGIFALAICAERIYTLYIKYKKPIPGFRPHLRGFIARNDYAGASEYLKESAATQALSRVSHQGFITREKMKGEDEVQARMDEQLSREISAVDRGTSFLGMIGNVSTLLGLLGTISGMIVSFAAVAKANPMDRATMLSLGIAEAMNCTAFGLIVAIPTLVAYAIFQSRTDTLVTTLSEESAGIYNDLVYTSQPMGRVIFQTVNGKTQYQPEPTA